MKLLEQRQLLQSVNLGRRVQKPILFNVEITTLDVGSDGKLDESLEVSGQDFDMVHWNQPRQREDLYL